MERCNALLQDLQAKRLLNDDLLLESVDRLLDVFRSAVQLPSGIPYAEVTEALLAVSSVAPWHLSQLVLTGLVSVIEKTNKGTPKFADLVKPGGQLVAEIARLLVADKRELRDASVQLLGALSATDHSRQGLVEVLTQLRQACAKPSATASAFEGLAAAIGYSIAKSRSRDADVDAFLSTLLPLIEYQDGSDAARHVQLEATRALERIVRVKKDLIPSSASLALKLLSNRDLDVRKAASLLLSAHDGEWSVIETLQKSVTADSKWESRHGVNHAILQLIRKDGVVSELAPGQVSSLAEFLVRQIHHSSADPEDPPSITCLANAEAAKALAHLALTSSDQDAVNQLVIELDFVLSSGEVLLLEAGVSVLARLFLAQPTLADTLYEKAVLRLFTLKHHSSCPLQQGVQVALDQIIGDSTAQGLFLIRYQLPFLKLLLQEGKTDDEAEEIKFRALTQLFEALLGQETPALPKSPLSSANTSSATLFSTPKNQSSASVRTSSFSSSSSSRSSSSLSLRLSVGQLDSLVQQQLGSEISTSSEWRQTLWEVLAGPFRHFEADAVSEEPLAAALDALQTYITLVAKIERTSNGTSSDMIAPARTPRRGATEESIGLNRVPLDKWRPINPSLDGIIESLTKCLATDSELLVPPALRLSTAVALGWGKHKANPLAGIVLTLANTPSVAYRFDALHAQLAVLGRTQSLSMNQLQTYSPETWIDPNITAEVQRRIGSASALLHVVQRISLWDDEGVPAFAPFVRSKSFKLHEDAQESVESHADAFKLLLPAVLLAFASKENQIPPIQSKVLAILYQFQRLRAESIENFVSSDEWTQHRLLFLFSAFFFQLVGKSDKFSIDSDSVVDEDLDVLEFAFPSKVEIESLEIGNETSFFSRLIMISAICGYFLPHLTKVDTRPVLDGISLLIRTLIARSPHYAAAVPHMGRLCSFDLIKELNIKEMDLGNLLVSQMQNEEVRKIEARVAALAPQGSLELSQDALALAVKFAKLRSDALHRMTATHLLNIFHNQLNLYGPKQVLAEQFQRFFEQLTEALPPQTLDLPEEAACYVALGIREDPVYGVEFGPFDPKFLSATVFNITDAIWESIEPVKLLTSAMEDLDAIFSGDFTDDVDNKNITLLSHCVAQTYFDTQLESILLPSCITFISNPENLTNEHYKYIVKLVKEIVWMWSRSSVLAQPKDWLVSLLHMAIQQQPQFISLGAGSVLIDMCFISSRILQFSTADDDAKRVLQLISDVLLNESIEEADRLCLQSLLYELGRMIDPLHLPKPSALPKTTV